MDKDFNTKLHFITLAAEPDWFDSELAVPGLVLLLSSLLGHDDDQEVATVAAGAECPTPVARPIGPIVATIVLVPAGRYSY